MAKIKINKNPGSTDMTAMCDVAFLLLTFFVMTSTAKIPEALPVDTPTSTVQTKLPETDLATLTVGKGKVFFDLKGREVRVRTLELMGEKYNVNFSDVDKATFSMMDDFGVPLLNLKQIIDMKAADRSKAGQPGIPLDSLDNQLKEWIYNARIANIEINDKELQIAIKGDAKEEYPAIKKVMDVLQEQKINSFSLVTGLRGKDF
ncbi:ExbD/TolR family protein [Flavobacterium glaciei]|uniref:Biopolymer transport protein ExbD/TolR n=1 Tax=Flavobacterium glaciei TaxID=386300 RepID=A0A562PLY8_9FLAO|nr:biopolymer transporter ExbD [Flavobacterium glaciei]RDI51176.1 outer membrane transport energization protein ExbD [Flavobacterium glaciei]TWI45056.1 biopolymer transport protein ExbD/TolR [Flavobacterium glaciei]